ncbi:hypothetical protein MCOR25_008028 [Pyricularia grisea]|nr:hypothetical protein MCOR25_008028 [Pyricularia grisea]
MNRNVEDKLYSGVVRPIDEAVRGLENRISLKIKAAKIPEKKNAVMPLRPAYGSKGIPVTLWTNYVEMTFGKGKDLVLYKYSIAISPPEAGKKQQRIIQLFLEKWKQDLPNFGQIYSDFKSFLISTMELDLDELEVIKNSSLDFIKDGQTEAPKNPDTYRAKVEAQGEFNVQNFLKYLSEEQAAPTFANKLDMIQVLNIFLNHYNKTNKSVVAVGANRTFSLDPQRPPPGSQPSRDRSARASGEVMDLGGGLEALRGFFTSIRPATGRLLININVTSAAFYKQGTLANLVNSFGTGSLFNLDKFLKRLRVEPTHLESKTSQGGAGSSKSSRKRYRTIFGLAREGDGASMPANERPKISMFGAGPGLIMFWFAREGQKGRYVTVTQYFQQTYGITLNPRLPVINVGNRERPTYFPIDICNVFPGQVAREKLTPAQMEQMVEFAAQRPWFNAEQITRSGLLLTGASNTVNNYLSENNIKVGTELITVPGRVLPQPKPQYAHGSEVSMSAGGWNMRNCRFFKVAGDVKPRPWGCLTLDRRYQMNSPYLESQVNAFHTHLRKAGLNLETCQIRGCNVGMGTSQDFSALDAMFSRCRPQRLNTGQILRVLDFVLVILPDKDASLYNMIKYLGDVLYGVPTVCVATRTFFPAKGSDQMFGNLGLKINLKLGGVNHKIENSLLGIVAQGKTMIVGIDVTHPAAGATAAPSIAAMVASTDSNLAQWPGEVSIQTQARKEQVDALTSMLQNRLKIWKARNNQSLPDNILVYRDGVSEGQYAMVQQIEIPLLEKACEAEYSPGKKPNMTVVVVGKRHHTRFYPTSTARPNMVKNNVAPGTVVDRGITEAHTWDFFLQSHEALKGTGRPAHYIVLMDEIFRPGFESGVKIPIRSGPSRGGGLGNSMHRGGGISRGGGGNRGGGMGQGASGHGAAQLNEADTLEMLTYSLCSVFGRATRSVSYATPAYFADILCERGRCWLAAYLAVRRPMDDAETASVLSAGEIRKITNPQAKQEAQQKLLEVQQQGRKAAMEACRVHPALKDTVFYL